MSRRDIRPQIFLLLCGLLTAGCVAATPSVGPAANPTQRVQGVPVPTDAAGNYIKSPDPLATPIVAPVSSCIVDQFIGQSERRTVADMAGSPAIVIGTFQGFGTTKWNTPGSRRPTPAEFAKSAAMLVRPVSIKVENILRGSIASIPHAIVRGGQLGCDLITHSDTPNLTVAVRYIFYLIPVADSDLKPSSDMLVVAAWPIDSNNMVDTVDDGQVPLSQIAATLPQLPTSPSAS